ncbi:MAG: hypothetical protein ACD_9C00016G0002 [uncultured bacterium]|nr:MAG: hypothetical protein ACD_9C00016G0002 [uncultured bacterium]
MIISKNLPQFETSPSLFIVSGDYEALFYFAFKGNILLKEKIRMAPREEAKEKQAFVGHKSGMRSLSAVSHEGKYDNDLKLKFAQKVIQTTNELINQYEIKDLYIFSPKYVSNRLLKGLNKSDKEKVLLRFWGEYTKESPFDLIRMIKSKFEEQ